MIIKNKWATFVGHKFMGKTYVVVQKWTAPDAPSATAVHAAVTLTAAAQTVTTSITNPDFPRLVTVKGNASGITGNVVIAGTNIRGESISDTIALNGASEVAGVKAFKTVTSITLPIQTHAGTDNVSVGISDKLGLQSIPLSTSVIQEISNNANDTGGAVLTRDSDEIEKNVFDPTTQCDGSVSKAIVYVSAELPSRVGGYTS
jgi:hypothetical protein